MKLVALVVILIFLNVVTALGVVHNQYQKRVIGIQMNQAEMLQDQAVDKWSQLLVEYATWSANTRIEKIAREQLGMRYEFDSRLYMRLQ